MPESLPEASGKDLFSTINFDTNRRSFLRTAGAIGAAGSVVGLLAACGKDDATAPVNRAVVTLPLTSDTDILKFALFLELLEADFYTKAVAKGILNGAVLTLGTSIRDHETVHVAALQTALGANAFTSSDVAFDFGASLNSQTTFLATAEVLEKTGVGAYLGALGSITSRSLRTTAGSIFTIEARHLAAIRVYNNASAGPVQTAFEVGVAAADVVAAVVGTGFVKRGLG